MFLSRFPQFLIPIYVKMSVVVRNKRSHEEDDEEAPQKTLSIFAGSGEGDIKILPSILAKTRMGNRIMARLAQSVNAFGQYALIPRPMPFSDTVLFMVTCTAGFKIKTHPFVEFLSSFACRLGNADLFVTFLRITRPYPGLLSTILPTKVPFCESFQLDNARYATLVAIVGAAVAIQGGRVLTIEESMTAGGPCDIPPPLLNMILSSPLSALVLRSGETFGALVASGPTELLSVCLRRDLPSKQQGRILMPVSSDPLSVCFLRDVEDEHSALVATARLDGIGAWVNVRTPPPPYSPPTLALQRAIHRVSSHIVSGYFFGTIFVIAVPEDCSLLSHPEIKHCSVLSGPRNRAIVLFLETHHRQHIVDVHKLVPTGAIVHLGRGKCEGQEHFSVGVTPFFFLESPTEVHRRDVHLMAEEPKFPGLREIMDSFGGKSILSVPPPYALCDYFLLWRILDSGDRCWVRFDEEVTVRYNILGETTGLLSILHLPGHSLAHIAHAYSGYNVYVYSLDGRFGEDFRRQITVSSARALVTLHSQKESIRPSFSPSRNKLAYLLNASFDFKILHAYNVAVGAERMCTDFGISETMDTSRFFLIQCAPDTFDLQKSHNVIAYLTRDALHVAGNEHMSLTLLETGDYYSIKQVNSFFWGEGTIFPLCGDQVTLNRLRSVLLGELVPISNCISCRKLPLSRHMRGTFRDHVFSVLIPRVCDPDFYTFLLGLYPTSQWEPQLFVTEAQNRMTQQKLLELPALQQMLLHGSMDDELAVNNLVMNMRNASIGPLLLGSFIVNQHPSFDLQGLLSACYRIPAMQNHEPKRCAAHVHADTIHLDHLFQYQARIPPRDMSLELAHLHFDACRRLLSARGVSGAFPLFLGTYPSVCAEMLKLKFSCPEMRYAIRWDYMRGVMIDVHRAVTSNAENLTGPVSFAPLVTEVYSSHETIGFVNDDNILDPIGGDGHPDAYMYVKGALATDDELLSFYEHRTLEQSYRATPWLRQNGLILKDIAHIRRLAPVFACYAHLYAQALLWSVGRAGLWQVFALSRIYTHLKPTLLAFVSSLGPAVPSIASFPKKNMLDMVLVEGTADFEFMQAWFGAVPSFLNHGMYLPAWAVAVVAEVRANPETVASYIERTIHSPIHLRSCQWTTAVEALYDFCAIDRNIDQAIEIAVHIENGLGDNKDWGVIAGILQTLIEISRRHKFQVDAHGLVLHLGLLARFKDFQVTKDIEKFKNVLLNEPLIPDLSLLIWPTCSFEEYVEVDSIVNYDIFSMNALTFMGAKRFPTWVQHMNLYNPGNNVKMDGLLGRCILLVNNTGIATRAPKRTCPSGRGK